MFWFKLKILIGNIAIDTLPKDKLFYRKCSVYKFQICVNFKQTLLLEILFATNFLHIFRGNCIFLLYICKYTQLVEDFSWDLQLEWQFLI